MAEKKHGSRIVDNATTKKLSNALPFVSLTMAATGLARRLGIKSAKLNKLHMAAEDLLKQSEILRGRFEIGHLELPRFPMTEAA